MIVGICTTMPDLHYTLDDLVAENDRVAVRWHIEGTQDGPFWGLPPTHKHISSTGMAIFQFKGNKIVASWLQLDQLGFLQQIGALPENILPIQQPQRQETSRP
jgi:predicted ester cyclase